MHSLLLFWVFWRSGHVTPVHAGICIFWLLLLVIHTLNWKYLWLLSTTKHMGSVFSSHLKVDTPIYYLFSFKKATNRSRPLLLNNSHLPLHLQYSSSSSLNYSLVSFCFQQIFLEVFPKVQSKLSENSREPQRHEEISGMDHLYVNKIFTKCRNAQWIYTFFRDYSFLYKK